MTKMLLLLTLTACSSSTPPNDASTEASTDASNDAPAEAAAVTCTTPGAACPSGGKCFFPIGDCSATEGVCADDSFCADAGTETVCACDNSQPQAPQCGPGNTALVKARYYGPCLSDAGAD